MKKARQVVINPTEEITLKEYNKLSDHAYNSAFWYATNYVKSIKELKEKLYDKGFPKDSVTVVSISGETTKRNFVDEAITRLVENYIVDEERTVERMVESRKARKYGKNRVHWDLIKKGFPEDLIKKYINEIYSNDTGLNTETLEWVEKEWPRLLKNSKTEFDAKKKLYQKSIRRGFDFDEINAALQNYLNNLSEN